MGTLFLNLPRHAQLQLLLSHHEARENADQCPSRCQHNYDPEVQLLVRPVVGLADHYSCPGHGAGHTGTAVGGSRGAGVVRGCRSGLVGEALLAENVICLLREW